MWMRSRSATRRAPTSRSRSSHACTQLETLPLVKFHMLLDLVGQRDLAFGFVDSSARPILQREVDEQRDEVATGNLHLFQERRQVFFIRGWAGAQCRQVWSVLARHRLNPFQDGAIPIPELGDKTLR